MRKETRIAVNAYTKKIASLNNVEDASEQFNVDPTVEQTLENKLRDSSQFLRLINSEGVVLKEGKKLGLSVNTSIASTTDTTQNDRVTQDPSSLDEDGYNCKKIDFDTHIDYDKLDNWAKFPDFQTRIQNLIIEQIAHDRIMAGFNGTSRAANSDRATNPLLQDVAVGWLQKLRANRPQNVSNNVTIGSGSGSDFKNIDQCVLAALEEYIDPWYREGGDLVVIAGREIVADKYLALVADTNAPSERAALGTLMSNKQLGSMPTIRVPHFPSDSFIITSLNNLSVYWQIGSRRRHIEDNAKRDQIEDYQSFNQDYVVENYGKMCLIEGIVIN